MNAPPARPHRWYSVSLVILLIATLFARFLFLDMDPPYGIVSTSGVFLTDEGWYSKAAQLKVRFDEWTSAYDFVWRSHNSLYTGIQVLLFELFGISVFVARGMTAGFFAIGIAAFYGICRTVQPRNVALVSCLLVSITIQVFAYSRMALTDPVGACVTLVALCAWVRGRGKWWCAPLSMVVVGLAPFFKVSFVYGVVAVVILNLGDAVSLWRKGRRRRAAITVAVVAAALGAMRWAQFAINDWAARDAQVFQKWHVDSRVDRVGLTFQMIKSTIRNELESVYHMTYSTGAVMLTATLAFGVVFVLVKRRFPMARIFGMSRATFAMSLWLLGGVSMFGLFRYQPPRYYFFAIFPLVYLTVMFVREASGQRHWRFVCLYLLFAHSAVQLPNYSDWLRRDRLHTYRDVILEVMTRIEPRREGEPIVLMGKTSSFFSLYDDRIRPLNYNHHDELRERVEHWRPQYVFCLKDDAWFLKMHCQGLVKDLDYLDEFNLLDNFYTRQSHFLIRIVYEDE